MDKNLPHIPLKRPIVLFAVPPNFIHRKQVEETFAPAGIRVVFVTQAREITENLKIPEIFLFYFDLMFSPDPLAILQQLGPYKKLATVTLAEQLSPLEMENLKRLGVVEFMLRPVHPTLLLVRAKFYLERASRLKYLPRDVLLPTKVSTATLAQPAQTTQKGSLAKDDAALRHALSVNALDEQSSASQHEASIQTPLEEDAALQSFPSIEVIRPILKVYSQITRSVKAAEKFDTVLWPQIKKFPKLQHGSFSELVNDSEQIFKSTNKVMRAKRTLLMSLRPSSDWPADKCPTQVKSLASSDDHIPHKELALATVLLPVIPIAFERQEAVLLPRPVSLQMAGLHRPLDWLLEGKAEQATALIPLFERRRIFAAIFMQFESFDAKQMPMLEQSVSYFQTITEVFARIDFLNRIYAQRL